MQCCNANNAVENAAQRTVCCTVRCMWKWCAVQMSNTVHNLGAPVRSSALHAPVCVNECEIDRPIYSRCEIDI